MVATVIVVVLILCVTGWVLWYGHLNQRLHRESRVLQAKFDQVNLTEFLSGRILISQTREVVESGCLTDNEVNEIVKSGVVPPAKSTHLNVCLCCGLRLKAAWVTQHTHLLNQLPRTFVILDADAQQGYPRLRKALDIARGKMNGIARDVQSSAEVILSKKR